MATMPIITRRSRGMLRRKHDRVSIIALEILAEEEEEEEEEGRGRGEKARKSMAAAIANT